MIRNTPLADVKLLDGPFQAKQESNLRYLLFLDPDRLLHNFRLNAGLPTKAKPLGGWEAEGHGLRGHFVGHYLAACATVVADTGNEELRARLNYMVEELAKCQESLGGEYLSAFPELDLEAIETKFEGEWASYYVLHKVAMGLVAAYASAGIEQALPMVTKLANYVKMRLDKVPISDLEKMLRTEGPNPTNETGGWSETLQDLYAITGDPAHAALAELFDCTWFVDPLVHQEDHLAGLHSNTHIPIALGLAKRHERTGDARYRDAVIYFWERTALARSYVNGGSSGPRPDGLEKSKGGEHWPEANKLALTLTPKINESCVTHNMLRLTDALFRWTADRRYAEFFERATFNSVLCVQHPCDLGRYIYDHPLSSGSHKVYGQLDETFWCCYGSSIEAFARLAQGIYYQDEDTLWVNMFVPSDLNWQAKGLRLRQETGFPNQDSTRLTVQCDSPTQFKLRLRAPSWLSSPCRVLLNGQEINATQQSGYLEIDRTWSNHDTLEAYFPMALRVEAMPDDPNLFSFLYGPIVLAARSSANLVVPETDYMAAMQNLTRKNGPTLEFETTTVGGDVIALIPLNLIGEEAFGVYFRLSGR